MSQDSFNAMLAAMDTETGAFSCLACGRQYNATEDADILDTLAATGKCFEDDGETDCPGLPSATLSVDGTWREVSLAAALALVEDGTAYEPDKDDVAPYSDGMRSFIDTTGKGSR